MNKTQGRRAAALAVAAVASIGTAGGAAAAPAGAHDHGGSLDYGSAHGVFRPPDQARNAFAYDTATIPAGARASVLVAYVGTGRTIVTLRVRGLLPNREYGSHAHSNACGATGADAGPHFQYRPSSHPSAANADNEIWLDFTTDRRGNGFAYAVQDWVPDAGRRPGSVIIHDHHTSTGGAEAPGTAGARAACLTVPF